VISENQAETQSAPSVQGKRCTVEPQLVRLNDAQAAELDRIVERRLAYMGGTTEDVRAYVAAEVVAAGLLVVGRAEGVAT
jgi:hypothetical protein